MAAALKDEVIQTGGSVLGEEAAFTGFFEGRDLTILGRFEGRLQLSGRLRVGHAAHVEAQAQAASMEIHGEFKGGLQTRLLVFGETAHAQGTFLCTRLAMKEGAWVIGAFNLSEPARQAESPPASGAEAGPRGTASALEATATQIPTPVAEPSKEASADAASSAESETTTTPSADAVAAAPGLASSEPTSDAADAIDVGRVDREPSHSQRPPDQPEAPQSQ